MLESESSRNRVGIESESSRNRIVHKKLYWSWNRNQDDWSRNRKGLLESESLKLESPPRLQPTYPLHRHRIQYVFAADLKWTMHSGEVDSWPWVAFSLISYNRLNHFITTGLLRFDDGVRHSQRLCKKIYWALDVCIKFNGYLHVFLVHVAPSVVSSIRSRGAGLQLIEI